MSKYLDGLNPIKLGRRLENRRHPGVMKEDGNSRATRAFAWSWIRLANTYWVSSPKPWGDVEKTARIAAQETGTARVAPRKPAYYSIFVTKRLATAVFKRGPVVGIMV